MKIETRIIVEALMQADGARSYSGRYMCGEKCLGLKGDSKGDALATAIKAMAESEELLEVIQNDAKAMGKLAARLCRSASSDNLGLRVIVYWPELSLENPDENTAWEV
jgi:type IV secretory pathway VirJ component